MPMALAGTFRGGSWWPEGTGIEELLFCDVLDGTGRLGRVRFGLWEGYRGDA